MCQDKCCSNVWCCYNHGQFNLCTFPFSYIASIGVSAFSSQAASIRSHPPSQPCTPTLCKVYWFKLFPETSGVLCTLGKKLPRYKRRRFYDHNILIMMYQIQVWCSKAKLFEFTIEASRLCRCLQKCDCTPAVRAIDCICEYIVIVNQKGVGKKINCICEIS